MQELRAQIQAQLKLADHLRKLGESGGESLKEDDLSATFHDIFLQSWMKQLKQNWMQSMEGLQNTKENTGKRLELMNLIG